MLADAHVAHQGQLQRAADAEAFDHSDDRMAAVADGVHGGVHEAAILHRLARIIALIGRMEFKRRQTCPGIKVSKVAFGIGRRIPIVEKWS